MYHCDTSNGRMVGCRSWLPERIVGGEGSLPEQIRLVIMALFAPETSGSGRFPAGFAQTRWWGAIKTLFWMMNAIVIGIIIANVCN